jgi:hypothetical protein
MPARKARRGDPKSCVRLGAALPSGNSAFLKTVKPNVASG